MLNINHISTGVQLAVMRMLSKSEHHVDIRICLLFCQHMLMPLLRMQVLLPPS